MIVKKTLVYIVIVFMFMFSVFVPKAGAATGFLPFGGKILVSEFCACSANFLLTIGPPTPGLYIYQAGVTRLFARYFPTSVGAWLLGIATPGGSCVMEEDECLTPIPAPTIIMEGTSIPGN